MKIEIGKTYKDGRGNIRKILGHTSYDKTFVWSQQGEHYRQSDGRYITCFHKSHPGTPTPQDIETPWDLIEEVPGEDYA